MSELTQTTGWAAIQQDSRSRLRTSLIATVASPACLDLTGYTRSIRELLMLFHASALLITNDGQFNHRTTSPKHKVPKIGRAHV